MSRRKLPFDKGFRKENKLGSWYTVVERSGTHSTIKFDSGYVMTALNYDVFHGKVKDKFFPEVCGFGFLGVGPYSASYIDEDGKWKPTREYRYWVAMLQRCLKPRNECYADVLVWDGWKNFQVFAEWCNSKDSFKNNDFVLDKDILVKGNREYHPNKCCFVPRKINSLFVKYGKGISHYFRRDTYEVSFGKKQIGRSKTKEDADEIHKNYFIKVVREAAEEFKNQLDIEVYYHLSNFKESKNVDLHQDKATNA